MKNILTIVFIVFYSFAKADTISYWHVYLNNEVVAKHNELSHQDVILKLSQVKVTDTLKIKYYTCWHSSTINNSINVLNSNNSIIESASSKGTGSTLYVPLNKLLTDFESSRSNEFSFVYFQDTLKGWSIIFRLKFE